MEIPDAVMRQVTLTETVTRDDSGTGWLRVCAGCRYFDVSITGDWRGRVTLEARRPGDVSQTVECLELFSGNTWKLFHLQEDSEVRLWVRGGELREGEVTLELGN